MRGDPWPRPWLWLLFLGASAAPVQAQEQHAEATLWVREAAGSFQAALEIEIEDGWHLYHDELGPDDALGDPTEVSFGGAGVRWSRPEFPTPRKFDQPFGKRDQPTWIYGHEGRITVYALGEPAPGARPEDVTATIEGLTCSEDLCLPYGETDVRSSGSGSESTWTAFPPGLVAASGGASPPEPDPPSDAGSRPASDPQGAGGAPVTRGTASGGDLPLLAFLGLAVFWGVFTLLMPCTYPMIPITISFFTKQAEQTSNRQLALSLAYGLGIIAIFILIGVVFGGVIIPFATHPVTNLVIGALFLVFALALFGAIELRPPSFLMDAAGRASTHGGFVGVFLMGATLVVTSFTCTAPFVGSLLAAGASGGLARTVIGMGVFGLTMAVPFVLLSMVPRRLAAMPKAGEWMHVLKVFMGFVELAAALKFLSNADLVWGWGWLSRELFLVLWMGIFAAAALFLFGLIRVEGESGAGIGPLRLVGATATLLFALYCGYGLDNELDRVMTAIIPNYSKRIPSGPVGVAQVERDHPIVKDDYDAARGQARSSGRALLVNFTGHT
jgi:thiol:disulfide interchange protein DsbD